MIHEPIEYHVSHWCEDPFSLGSWSQLLVGGTPLHRKQLGSPFSEVFILAGEACDDQQGIVNVIRLSPSLRNNLYSTDIRNDGTWWIPNRKVSWGMGRNE
jgi:hypothetical protein